MGGLTSARASMTMPDTSLAPGFGLVEVLLRSYTGPSRTARFTASNKRDGMTFTSWQFGIFVVVVFVTYYLPLMRSFQVQWLVLASLFFYGYGQPELLPLLAIAVLGTYIFLILAMRDRSSWLPVGIVFNLLLLVFFKYKFYQLY